MLSLAKNLQKSHVDFFSKVKEKIFETQVKKYEPNIRFVIEHKDFIIKTVETSRELLDVLRLRHQIFQQHHTHLSLDFDKFDFLADHIVLYHKNDQTKPLGTYRVLFSENTDTFYSEKEFHLDDFLYFTDSQLELGRACIAPEFRKGISLHLIWKGLAKYISLTNAKYLFGCSSFYLNSPKTAVKIYQELKDQHFSQDFHIFPRDKFVPSTKNAPSLDVASDVGDLNQLIPNLVKSYLKAGAKLYGMPAYDKDFNCYDFMCILEISKLNAQYNKKYFSDL